MLVKVSNEHIIIDHEDCKLHSVDLNVSGSRIVMSLDFFKELEHIFSRIRKGLDDVSNNFEFKTK